MVAASSEVTSVPLAVRFFGQELVLYRGQSGRAYMVDAYCPHMGAHLAKNTTSYVVRDNIRVEGDSIRCPYHAWRFDDPHYVRWEIDQLGVLPCHPIEVIDNMADVAHLGPTHGGPAEYFHNEISGVVVRQRQGAGHRTLAPGFMLETDTFYTGPGVLLSYFNGGMAVMYIAHTPVDDGSIKVWHGLLSRTETATPGADDISKAREAQAGSLAAFAQDFEIWRNKRPCFAPLAVPTDGAFAKVRMWYRQFFNERAKAAEFQARCAGFHAVKGMPAHNPRVA
jgi:3-ketosteroid 9alpha-monooxygenase subunit A